MISHDKYTVKITPANEQEEWLLWLPGKGSVTGVWPTQTPAKTAAAA